MTLLVSITVIGVYIPAASTLLKCTIVVASVAFVIHLIGLATPSWTVTEYGSEGLFQSSFEYSVAAITVGLLSGFGAVICCVLYPAYWPTHRNMRRFSSVLSFVAALFTILGVATYGIFVSSTRGDASLGYSYGVTVLAGLVHIIPVVLVELDRREKIKTGQLLE